MVMDWVLAWRATQHPIVVLLAGTERRGESAGQSGGVQFVGWQNVRPITVRWRLPVEAPDPVWAALGREEAPR